LVAGLATAACEESSGPAEAAGEARVSVTTTGLDLDLDGYRVLVGATDQGVISPNGTTVIQLEPGTWQVALASIEANCTVSGADSREVSIVEDGVAQVDFAVVCTATSGVIAIVVGAAGTNVDGAYDITLDGATELSVGLDGPAYVGAVPAGDHVVSLDAPHNCLVENSSQTVSVTTGGLVRDTVEARFAVTCGTVGWNVRITAPTVGVVPPSTRYRVVHGASGYWDIASPVTELGSLDPNGTLTAHVDTGEHWLNYWHVFRLEDVPSSCSVSDPHPYPDPGFTVPASGVLKVEFKVACPP
jgi:hypothetical protein